VLYAPFFLFIHVICRNKNKGRQVLIYKAKTMQDNEKMDTLVDCLNILRKRGFTKEFKLELHGLCAIDEEHHRYGPADMKIVEHFRFEGDSDPADMTVVYALEANDGVKGTVIDAFGTYSNPKLSEFLRKVEEVKEKANSH
jgi:hypothetical protein